MKLALVSTLVLATTAALVAGQYPTGTGAGGAGAGNGTAGGFGDVSPQCASAYQNLLSNKDVLACYDFSTLYSDTAAAITDPEKYETQFLDQFCTNPSCSADVFTNAFTPIVSACGADTYAGALADIIVRFYGPLKDAACLKNSTGGYCLIESTEKLTPYENVSSVNDIPTDVLCTTCNKAFVGISQAIVQNNAAYLTAFGFDKASYDAQIALISSKCGADFTTPSSLTTNTSGGGGSGSGGSGGGGGGSTGTTLSAIRDNTFLVPITLLLGAILV